MADNTGSFSRIRFGPFEADIDEGELRKLGVRIRLQRQPFQILAAMLAKPNQLVSRDELRQLIWSTDTFVDFEHGLNAAVNKLRQALMDSSANPRYIETVAGRGYRFIAPVEPAEARTDMPLMEASEGQVNASITTRVGRYWIWGIVCGAVLLGIIFGWLLHRSLLRPTDTRLLQFTIPNPDNLFSEPAFSHQDFAISPDGSRLAFLASDFKESQLWIRELSSAKTFRLTTERNVTNLAWSRDSQSLYFSELSNVRRVPVSGGASVGICEMPPGTIWNTLVESDKELTLFTRSGTAFTVPKTGGTPVQALARDLQYIWPQLLPNRRLLYISFDPAIHRYRAWVSDMAHPQARKQLLETDSRVQYSPAPYGGSTGYLLYIRAGTLVAQPFDENTLRLSGEIQPIADDVFWFEPSGAAAFSVSENGMLVYRQWRNNSQLKWVDRKGHDLEAIGKPNSFLTPFRLSPDRTKLATAIYDSRKGGTDIWSYDMATHLESRLTWGVGQTASPIWADNERFAFVHALGALPKMYWTNLKKSSPEQEFAGGSGAFQLPTDWSQNGRFLLYQTSGSATSPGASVMLLDLVQQGKRIPLVESSSQELAGVFSPDTSSIAFLSNETGPVEAYVQSFKADPEPHLSGERLRISSDGASLIRWRPDGKEIYYLNSDNWITAVGVKHENGNLYLDKPQKLFHLETTPQNLSSGGAVNPGFDVSIDGQKFIIADPRPLQNASFVVIENWQKLVKP